MGKTEAIYIRLSADERKKIEEGMALCKIENMSAYILKMAIDGMIINLDIPEMKEILSLLRYSSNNINQIAKKLNSSKTVYADDFNEIKANQRKIIDLVNGIYKKLYKL